MKQSSLSVKVLIAGIACLLTTARAAPPPVSVPDGGSSVVFVAISMTALVLGRRLLRYARRSHAEFPRGQ